MTIPPILVGNIRRYVQHGLYPGGFLDAVLSSNIFAAYDLGDAEAQQALGELVVMIKTTCPGNCYGSKERVQRWCHLHGVDGHAEARVS